MIRLLVSDLDGNLLTDEKTVSKADQMPLHVNRGSEIKLLLDLLSIERNEVVCMEDLENDISMFDSIHSFVMKSASSIVQSNAARISASVTEAVYWIFTFNRNNANTM